MTVAKYHHATVARKAPKKLPAALGRLPLARGGLGPVTEGRLFRGQLVEHMDSDAAIPPSECEWKLLREPVNIATHRPDGRHCPKLIEYQQRTYVTSMQDFVHTRQE